MWRHKLRRRSDASVRQPDWLVIDPVHLAERAKVDEGDVELVRQWEGSALAAALAARPVILT